MMSIGVGTSKPSLVMRMAVWTSGNLPFGELAVHGRSGDLDYLADYVRLLLLLP